MSYVIKFAFTLFILGLIYTQLPTTSLSSVGNSGVGSISHSIEVVANYANMFAHYLPINTIWFLLKLVFQIELTIRVAIGSAWLLRRFSQGS